MAARRQRQVRRDWLQLRLPAVQGPGQHKEQNKLQNLQSLFHFKFLSNN